MPYIPTKEERIELLDKSLTNQSPSAESIEKIEALREKAKELGKLIIETTPTSREQSIALNHYEDAIMWAVKAIVLNQ